MSLNQYMHTRNPFKDKKIDFAGLASKYEFLKNVICTDEINSEMVVDFKSPAHLSAISRALLMDTFNLDVYMPLDRLIPTIPLRMNYILWIEDLLQSSPLRDKSDIRVLDIGAGASCIYGLLGAHLKNWKFYATEIDADNCATAEANVKRNNLNHLIEVIPVEIEASLLGAVVQHTGPYIDIVMCNPPFFASSADKCGGLNTRNVEERDEAKSVNTGHRSESVVEGGETVFVKRLIDESVALGDRVGIFTVMLGKKSSSDLIRQHLHSLNIENQSIYELCQGRVMRWGVAWSFMPLFDHPRSQFRLTRVKTRCSISWLIPTDLPGLGEYSVNAVYGTLRAIFRQLEMTVLEQRNKQREGGGHHLLVTASRDTWSHQRRRRREMARLAAMETQSQADGDVDQEPACKRRRVAEEACGEAGALETGSGASSVATDSCILRCKANLVTVANDGEGAPLLKLDLRLLDGDKDALNQVLTFLKNRLLKPV